MILEPHRWIGSLWIVLAIVWPVGALTTKQTMRREHAATRILHLAIMVLAFGLVI